MAWLLTPEEYVKWLYVAVLQRNPDPEGLIHWAQLVRTSNDPTLALSGFVASDEFKLKNDLVTRRNPSDYTGGEISISFEELRRRALDQLDAGLPPGVDVIVAVFNASKWLSAICDGYDALRIRPLYIVDAASNDDSLAILQQRKTRVLTATNKHARVESLLAELIPYLGSRWIFRLDDDELPSQATLKWISQNILNIRETAVSLPRRWIRRSESASDVHSCIAAHGPSSIDEPLRLFQPSKVEPIQTIHTPGFRYDSLHHAPADACFYHFDWIVRSYEERLTKIERYEASNPGSGWKFEDYYFPEELPVDFYDQRPVTDPVILSFCEHVLCDIRPTDRFVLNGRERHILHGIKLDIPRSILTPKIRRSLRRQEYETLEIRMLEKVLRPTDKVVELGGAIGFVSSWMAKKLSRGRVFSFEANPELVDAARHNFKLNNVDVSLENCMVVSSEKEAYSDFYIHEDYWASSANNYKGKKIIVRTKGLEALIKQLSPDVILVDIEGGELSLFDDARLDGVRNIVVEFHPDVIGNAGVSRVFNMILGLGFYFDAMSSSQYVCSFVQRGEAGQARQQCEGRIAEIAQTY